MAVKSFNMSDRSAALLKKYAEHYGVSQSMIIKYSLMCMDVILDIDNKNKVDKETYREVIDNILKEGE